MKLTLLALAFLASFLVSTALFAQSPAPLDDEAQLAAHQKESEILRTRIEARKKAMHARDVAGITVAPPETSTSLYTNGVKVEFSYTGDDSDALGGPAESWSWVISGPDGVHPLQEKSISVSVKQPGSYQALLIVAADGGHRQQSHKLHFKVNIPVEIEQ